MINKLIKQIKENKKRKEETEEKQVYFQKCVTEIILERAMALKHTETVPKIIKSQKQYFLDSEKYLKIFK